MDNALGVYHDINFLDGHIKEPPRLKHLKALVHHRRGINRDLRPHLPARMIQGLLHGDGPQIDRGIEERPPRCRENKAINHPIPSLKTLKNGGVLTVDGQKLHAFLPRGSRHEFPRHNHHFFCGKGNIHTLLNRRERGFESA